MLSCNWRPCSSRLFVCLAPHRSTSDRLQVGSGFEVFLTISNITSERTNTEHRVQNSAHWNCLIMDQVSETLSDAVHQQHKCLSVFKRFKCFHAQTVSHKDKVSSSVNVVCVTAELEDGEEVKGGMRKRGRRRRAGALVQSLGSFKNPPPPFDYCRVYLKTALVEKVVSGLLVR